MFYSPNLDDQLINMFYSCSPNLDPDGQLINIQPICYPITINFCMYY